MIGEGRSKEEENRSTWGRGVADAAGLELLVVYCGVERLERLGSIRKLWADGADGRGAAMQLRIWANGKLCSLGKHCWQCVGDDKLADYLTRHHWPARKNPKREFELLVATVEALAADRHLKPFAIREMHPTLEFVTSKQQAVLRTLHRQYRDRGGHMWPCHPWIEHDTEDERWLKAEVVFDSDSGGLEE